MTTCSPRADAGQAPFRAAWPVFDGHVDLVYALHRRAAVGLDDSPFAPSRLAAGGVRLLVSALYCPDCCNGPPTAAHLKELLAADHRWLASLPLVASRSRLATIWEGGGAPGRLRLLENADALLEFGVAAACAAGIVAVGLTHAGRNRLADGNAVAFPGGLTAAGCRLLAELAAADRVVDLAHLAEPGFWEVLERYPGPLVCSHTGLRRFCDRPRNLDDTQLAALLERGGVVGVAFAPELLAATGQAGSLEVFSQIDWLVQRFGAGQVALGSDFGGFDGVCTELEDHTRLPDLAERFARAGYPPAAIAGILGENWRRFYAAVLPP